MSNNQYFIQDMSKHYGLPMKLNDFGIISNTLGRQGCFFASNTVDGYYSIPRYTFLRNERALRGLKKCA